MRFFTLILMSIISQPGFGHGEDKVGPHGGYIRMPGAFHTEVVETEKAFHVYLLDIEWKNPAVQDSSVQLELQLAGKTVAIHCDKQQDIFLCRKPDQGLKVLSRIVVKATRQNKKGAAMTYEYPLKTVSDHSGH